MKALGILIVGILILAIFLALTSMFMAMAPYLAAVVILMALCWLAGKAPEPREKRAPPRWPEDPNDFR